MIQNTIEYNIKNKIYKKQDSSILVVVEDIILDNSLEIDIINKLSISADIQNSNIVNFEYNEEVKNLEVIMLIEGQIEYLNSCSEIKIFHFTLSKNIWIPYNISDFSPEILISHMYIHEAICRKLSEDSCYISLLADFNIDTL